MANRAPGECGRYGRGKFFVEFLYSYMVSGVASFFVTLAIVYEKDLMVTILGWFVIFGATTAMFYTPVVSRLHDLGRPAIHGLLLFVPFYGLYLELVLLFQGGMQGPNQYGPDPLARAGKRA
jgi:uncharacterized membrane protein YhaH (DUF805 family)